MRQDDDGSRHTTVGAASNSLVYTRFVSTPVPSFFTPGAVAMYHDDRDPDGGSSGFFFLPSPTPLPDKVKGGGAGSGSGSGVRVSLQRPVESSLALARLDDRYAIFGYVVDGLEVLDELQVRARGELLMLLITVVEYLYYE